MKNHTGYLVGDKGSIVLNGHLFRPGAALPPIEDKPFQALQSKGLIVVDPETAKAGLKEAKAAKTAPVSQSHDPKATHATKALSPDQIESKSLDDLRLLCAEHGHKGRPFEKRESAVEFLTKNLPKA